MYISIYIFICADIQAALKGSMVCFTVVPYITFCLCSDILASISKSKIDSLVMTWWCFWKYLFALLFNKAEVKSHFSLKVLRSSLRTTWHYGADIRIPSKSRMFFQCERRGWQVNWGPWRLRLPVCVHGLDGQSWLDAQTNQARLLSRVTDHRRARACHCGGEEWFMPRSPGLSRSQYKQLQSSRLYPEHVCVWVRGEREKREILLPDRAGIWAMLVCRVYNFFSRANRDDSVLRGRSCQPGHGMSADNSALSGYNSSPTLRE